MLSKQDKKTASILKKIASEKLEAFGIQDRFVVKVRPTSNENWVAQYRANSQFTNWHMGPIFWVREDLLDNPREFVLSVLHEYGHVIAEYAWNQKSPNNLNPLYNLLSKNWKGQFFFRPWDEEEFAEQFAQYVVGSFSNSKKALNKVITTYAQSINN